MKVQSEKVTPQVAAEYLGHNGHNRNVNQRHVARLAGAMRRGEWKLNGEAIKRDSSGRLIDGQHRLLAVLEADKAVEMLVVSGLAPSSQETIDIGRSRSVSDMLALRGEANAISLAAALRLAFVYDDSAVFTSATLNTITPQQLFRYLKANPEIRGSIAYARKVRNAGLSLPMSWASMLHFQAARLDAEGAEEFFVALADGTMLLPESPIYVLRQRYLRHEAHPVQSRVKGAWCAKAWNAWQDGVEVTQFRWNPGGKVKEPFPRLRLADA